MAYATLAAPQGFTGDPSLARILQEQRFNMGDGKFGAAFAQEDGVAFKEESAGNNERIGQYSYIDENGKTITVKYSAGVNGFRYGRLILILFNSFNFIVYNFNISEFLRETTSQVEDKPQLRLN